GRPARGERFGHRAGGLAAEIDVEDGHVELGRLQRRQPLGNLGRLCRDREAEIQEHILDQHADHDVVLDDEDPSGPEPVLTHPLSPIPARTNSPGWVFWLGAFGMTIPRNRTNAVLREWFQPAKAATAWAVQRVMMTAPFRGDARA